MTPVGSRPALRHGGGRLPPRPACPSPPTLPGPLSGGDRTVCFTLSSQLSGTYHAACIAREMVLEEHPEKQICVIDSRAAAGTMVLLIRRAQALMEATGDDGDFDALCQRLHRYQATLRTCFTLENFDNLIKNGRMRPIEARCSAPWASTSLRTPQPRAPFMWRIRPGAWVRPYRAITALMKASKDCTDAEVVISHCENLEEVLWP